MRLFGITRRLAYCCPNCSMNISTVIFPDWMIVLHCSSSVRSPETIADSLKMVTAGGKVLPLAFFHCRKTPEFATNRQALIFCVCQNSALCRRRWADGMAPHKRRQVFL